MSCSDRDERTSGHHGRRAADDAVAFLNEEWNQDRPLFMYIGFAGPHEPRVAADQWLELYDRDQVPLPINYLAYHPFDNGELGILDEQQAPWPRTEEEVRKHLRDYYACISSIDYQIGRIFQALEQLDEFDNTIIVFSSDHGLAIGSHGLLGKQNVYEHSMQAPLIFSGPGIPQGTSDAFVYLFDIFPTIAELAGAKTPDGLDGKSLVSIIRGHQDAVHEAVFLAYRNVQRAVRSSHWKLIRYPQVNVTQLFNLQEDAHELNNLAEQPAYAHLVVEMMKQLVEQQKLYGDTQTLSVESPDPAAVDENFFEQFGKKK